MHWRSGIFAGCFCQINIPNWQEKCHIYNINLYMYCQLGDYMPKNRSMKATHFLHYEKPAFQTSGRVTKSQQKSNFPDPNKPGWCFFRKKKRHFCGAKIPQEFQDGCIYYVFTLRFCWVFSAQCANFVVRDFWTLISLSKKGWTHLYKHS